MKTAVLVLSILFASGATNAQTTSGGAHGSGPGPVLRQGNSSTTIPVQSGSRLAALLELNETQRAQLQAILNEQQAKMAEFAREEKDSSGHTPSATEIQAEWNQLQAQSMDKLRAILTDAQMQKLKEIGQGALE
jgi:hypothetical protein